MAVEVPQNEEISERGKNGGRKGVGSTVRWRGANRGGGRTHQEMTPRRSC